MLDRVVSLQRAFLKKHGDTVEQMLQLVIVMMPVRSREGQMGFREQAVYSLIDLFSQYRNFVLRAARPLLVEPSSQNHRIYSTIAFLLRGLRSIQVLFEIYAHREGGRKAALGMCLRIEFIKVLMKAACVRLLPFPIYIDDESVEKDSSAGEYVGKRGGMRLPAYGSLSSQTIVRQQSSPRQTAGEAFFHLRPFLHLLLLRFWGEDKWSWLASVIPDLLSLKLLDTGGADANPEKSTLMQQELHRRRALLVWAFMRSPFFEKVFETPLHLLNTLWKKIPVLMYFNIIELFLLLRPFYFSTSGT
eukprot:GEMP01024518.1.p1 GENE.GEMP01024518.1~~GEMP01024518.1.p1  ORF type:complete len:303 (+),score=45.76 GEMP01024518.1:287-1195(+)